MRTRGAALAIVVLTALLCSIAAYAVLIGVRSGVRRSTVIANKIKAQYLAEAGMVIAMQKLRRADLDPTSSYQYPPGCSPGSTADGNATESVNANDVQITVTNCGPRQPHKLSATVKDAY